MSYFEYAMWSALIVLIIMFLFCDPRGFIDEE